MSYGSIFIPDDCGCCRGTSTSTSTSTSTGTIGTLDECLPCDWCGDCEFTPTMWDVSIAGVGPSGPGGLPCCSGINGTYSGLPWLTNGCLWDRSTGLPHITPCGGIPGSVLDLGDVSVGFSPCFVSQIGVQANCGPSPGRLPCLSLRIQYSAFPFAGLQNACAQVPCDGGSGPLTWSIGAGGANNFCGGGTMSATPSGPFILGPLPPHMHANITIHNPPHGCTGTVTLSVPINTTRSGRTWTGSLPDGTGGMVTVTMSCGGGSPPVGYTLNVIWNRSCGNHTYTAPAIYDTGNPPQCFPPNIVFNTADLTCYVTR
jgi:hypothetical protein